MTVEVTDIGWIPGPDADEAGFAVVMVYCAIGAVLCGLWAAAAGWALRDLGWPLIPYVVLGASFASLVAWRVGSRLGPDDPEGLPPPQTGDRVQSMLELGSPAPALVWPSAAVLAVLLVSWLDRPSRRSRSGSR